MRKKLSFAVAVVVVVAAALLFTHRRAGRSPRHVTVGAPARLVFAAASDLRRWSPWCRPDPRDPGRRLSFGGPEAGVGASCYWNGSSGSGRMTLVGAGQGKLEIELEPRQPRPAELDLTLTVAGGERGARVSLEVAGEGLHGWLPVADELATRLEAAAGNLREAAEADAKLETSRIERTATVAAPVAAVLAHLADARRWSDWSPWGNSDSTARLTYGGPASGRGATAYWNGDHGAGRLTIISAGPERVTAELETVRPRDSLSDLDFALSSEGGVTRITASAMGGVSAEELEAALTRLGNAVAAEAMRAAK